MIEHDLSMEIEAAGSHGVVANDLSISIGTKELISGADFVIGSESKVALIGRNGSGKTTLLDMIFSLATANTLPDVVGVQGSLVVLPGTKVGYLPQSIQITFAGSVSEYLDFCSGEVSRVFNRYGELTELLNGEQPDKELLDEYGEILEKMTDLDAWDLPRQKTIILEGLGLSDEFLERDIKEVSGGEATKVALAGILVSSPNLILMDEPSNNLDPKSLFFLEEWIKNSTASLLVVSHDRQFLDNVINEVLEIDEGTKGIIRFGGNYSFYAARKKEMFNAQVRQFEEQSKKRRQLEVDAERLRKQAKEFESTSTDSFYRAKGAGLARRAKTQLARIERDLSSVPEPVLPRKPSITVFDAGTGQELLVSASDTSFVFPETDRKIVDSVTLQIYGRDRVGIIGPNGAGKTTLLKLLLGEIEPTSGTVSIGRHTRIAYLSQAAFLNDPKQSVVEFLRHRVPMHEDDARTILGRVLFADPSHMSIGNFSFGELKRISLVGVFASRPNLIALDEPTNHLDVYTIEMLEEALRGYNGGVVVVSHDERFLVNAGINRMVVMDGRGNLAVKNVRSAVELDEIFKETFK